MCYCQIEKQKADYNHENPRHPAQSPVIKIVEKYCDTGADKNESKLLFQCCIIQDRTFWFPVYTTGGVEHAESEADESANNYNEKNFS